MLSIFVALSLLGSAHHAKPLTDYQKCDRHDAVQPCIRWAGKKEGASVAVLMRRAWCESRFNKYARNPSGASGLFQFMPGTWRWTPWGDKSIWRAKYQSLAAAWMEARGLGFHWVCR